MLTDTGPPERQYRPSYTHVPKSIEPSNFGAPLPPSMKAGMRDQRRASIQAFGRKDMSLRSAPTVATSGLTASASTNNMAFPGKPTHSASRLRTPTRIPSPTCPSKAVAKRGRISSTLRDYTDSDGSEEQTPRVLNMNSSSRFLVDGEKFEQVRPTNQRINSGNIPQVNSLLRPINPELPPQPPPHMVRSRTMNVFTNITNSLIHTSMSKSSSKLSISSYSTGTTSRASSGPASFFRGTSRPNTPVTPAPSARPDGPVDLHKVDSGMAHAYWLGRYTSLDDQYRSAVFEPDYREDMDVHAALKDIMKKKGQKYKREMGVCLISEIRAHKIFRELEEHCITPDAKQSLWGFQQAYARMMDNPNLLPSGGTMEGKENIFSKAGKFFIKRSGSGSVDWKKAEKTYEERNADAKMVEAREEARKAEAKKLELRRAEERRTEERRTEEKRVEQAKMEGKKPAVAKKKNGRPEIGNPVLITRTNQHQQNAEVISTLTGRGFSWEADGANL